MKLITKKKALTALCAVAATVGANAQVIQKDLSRGNIERLHTGKKEIVITIDDGPTPGVTDRILDTLAENNVKATFFVVGTRAQRFPELMARMAREGHTVANHTLNHKMIGDLADKGGFFSNLFNRGGNKEIKDEILGAHEVIYPYLENTSRIYFRAPGASWDSKAADIINKTDLGQYYHGPVLWDVGGQLDKTASGVRRAADWGCWSRGWSVSECLQGYVRETNDKKGGVVLFHDLNRKSASLIEGYIKTFKNSDYRFVEMDDVDLN